jgi:hypothetical protein
MNAGHFDLLSRRALERAKEWSESGDLLVSLMWWRLHQQWQLLADEAHNRNTEAIIAAIDDLSIAAGIMTRDEAKLRYQFASRARWVDGPDSPGVLHD